MTVFPDGTKEALHGHNYSVEASIETADVSLNEMVSFSYFKGILKGICDHWDEKVLVAENCPFLEMKNLVSAEVEFVLCRKRYVLPREEVVFLPVDNITVENLSEEFCNRFVKKIDSAVLQKITEVSIKIEESPGQGATFFWENKKTGRRSH